MSLWYVFVVLFRISYLVACHDLFFEYKKTAVHEKHEKLEHRPGVAVISQLY